MKIVIIGAGPAGLTAAYECLSQLEDAEVVVLEEDMCVGGISKTVSYHGNRMDLGGHRFFSKSKQIKEWWQQMLPLENQDRTSEETDEIMLVRHRVSRIFYNGHFFDYPISFQWNMIGKIGVIQFIKVCTSYLKTCFVHLPEESLENFYINRFGKELYQMFFEGYTQKLWGIHPKDLPADWGAQRVKGLSILSLLAHMLHLEKESETSLIETFWYPKFGPGQLWEKVEHEIKKKGAKVRKGAKVLNFYQENDTITSLRYCNQEGKICNIKGDIFLSTMPLKDVANAFADMPKHIKQIGQGLVYRDFVTLGLYLDDWNLKNETAVKTWNQRVPDCWIYVQDGQVKLGRIQVFNNWSPYLVKNEKEKLWIGLEYFCNEGDEFWNLSEEQCMEYAVAELQKMNILSKNQTVLDYHREKVKKAYPSYVGTYQELPKLCEYLNKRKNLYCIGRNGQHRYNNMDHSMMTALKAVEHIKNSNFSKEEIWKVNGEQEYLEDETGESTWTN